MMRPAVFLCLLPALFFGGCQLYLLDPPGDDEEDNGTGLPGAVSLSVQASEGGGLTQFVLTMFSVAFVRSGGEITRFDISEADFSLFSGVDGVPVITGIELPSGEFRSLRIGALDGRDASDGSFIDTPATPLEVPGNLMEFSADFRVRSSGSNTFTLVIHTAAALLPSQSNGEQFFRFRPTGYMVRSDRAGYVRGTINDCANVGQDELAVYVFDPEAELRDIRGPVGNQNEPLVSFAADANGDFLSPPLPTGTWQFSYTCQALDDQPDTAEDAIAEELRGNAVSLEVVFGEPSQAGFLNFP